MSKKVLSVVGLFLILLLAFIIFGKKSDETTLSNNFVSKVDNKYFSLNVGSKFIFERKSDEGLEIVEVVVTSETKKVMGINTIVVHDTVDVDGELHEDTRDYYAQDKEGNVWYFGESVDNYEGGKVIDHKGSWEAGVDGAEPGIVMYANPEVGKIYKQEYYKGVAEDLAKVISLNTEVEVPYGKFKNCLQTEDWNPLENAQHENKYYCPDVGFITLEEGYTDLVREELVRVEK